ncbi:MAG: hypothetical protein MZV70_10950 [Desulfobacterales bacterium]|nr:hypothetical protein [Desulfobacterales bacterium]
MLDKRVGDSFEAVENLTGRATDVAMHDGLELHPREFSDYLDKADVTDLRLGDHVKKEMTIFFSDIRAFTELSESLTVEERLRLHQLLSLPRRAHHPGERGLRRQVPRRRHPRPLPGRHRRADQAHPHGRGHAGQDDRVQRPPRQRGSYRPIAMGVGIHTGALMLGVVGVSDRMENTVISDAVNLASRLQAITKAFNISVAISEQAFKELEDPGAYKYRFIGKVKVKGKAAPISVFEIFDGIEPEPLRAQDEGQHLLRAGHALVLPEGLRGRHVLLQAGDRHHPRGRGRELLPRELHEQGGDLRARRASFAAPCGPVYSSPWTHPSPSTPGAAPHRGRQVRGGRGGLHAGPGARSGQPGPDLQPRGSPQAGGQDGRGPRRPRVRPPDRGREPRPPPRPRPHPLRGRRLPCRLRLLRARPGSPRRLPRGLERPRRREDSARATTLAPAPASRMPSPSAMTTRKPGSTWRTATTSSASRAKSGGPAPAWPSSAPAGPAARIEGRPASPAGRWIPLPGPRGFRDRPFQPAGTGID